MIIGSGTRKGVDANAFFTENNPMSVICLIMSAMMTLRCMLGQKDAALSYIGS